MSQQLHGTGPVSSTPDDDSNGRPGNRRRDVKPWAQKNPAQPSLPTLSPPLLPSPPISAIFAPSIAKSHHDTAQLEVLEVDMACDLPENTNPNDMQMSFPGVLATTHQVQSPVGNDSSSYDPTDKIVPDTLEAIEAFQAACSELGRKRLGAGADGCRVPLSQRIHMARMQAEREVMFRQAGFVPGNASARGVGLTACNGDVDSEMRGAMMLARSMGPLRLRLSSDVAMRCTNLVYSKPRMRRRRLRTDSTAATPVGSVSSTRDRKSKLGRRQAQADCEQPCPATGQRPLPHQTNDPVPRAMP